jgi:hypothetical protein
MVCLVSQVRSLTLDDKVWERSMVALFEGLGNWYANAAWEEAFNRSLSGSGPLARVSNGWAADQQGVVKNLASRVYLTQLCTQVCKLGRGRGRGIPAPACLPGNPAF